MPKRISLRYARIATEADILIAKLLRDADRTHASPEHPPDDIGGVFVFTLLVHAN